MIVAVDAQYAEDLAAVACVTFADWTDAAPAAEHATLIRGIAPYTPGEFWRRELPCIRAALQLLAAPPTIVVVDGYVWLDGDGRKGLGARLFDELGGGIPVVGVAKRPFAGAINAALVCRGGSEVPLHVTAQGLPAEAAEAALRAMHGPYRIPSLLKRVDRLCRDTLLGAR